MAYLTHHKEQATPKQPTKTIKAPNAGGDVRPIKSAPMSTNQLDKKSQAWSALFSEPMSELVKRYTASVFFDKRLWQADITGSLAHAEMLAALA